MFFSLSFLSVRNVDVSLLQQFIQYSLCHIIFDVMVHYHWLFDQMMRWTSIFIISMNTPNKKKGQKRNILTLSSSVFNITFGYRFAYVSVRMNSVWCVCVFSSIADRWMTKPSQILFLNPLHWYLCDKLCELTS